MNRIRAATLVLQAVLLAATGGAATAAERPAVRPTLERLQAEALWGEITLTSGGVRQIRVEALTESTVTVREVIGPLQARPAEYELAAIRSARTIGVHRIPRRVAPYRPPRSATMAMAIELVLPGFGYFYAGELRQGYALLGVSAVAAATAVATGKDGGAGWIPFAAWTKVASVLHLGDQVRAANAARRERAQGLGTAALAPAPTVSLVALNVRF